MLYILAIVLGTAAGLAAGGKLGNVFNFKFEKVWILLLAFAVQVLSQIMCYNGYGFFSENSLIIHGLVFLMLFTAMWFNRHYLGVLSIGAGSFLNVLVMMANGGKMPVALEAIKAADIPADAVEVIRKGLDSKHAFISEGTRLSFLADTIHPPSILSILMQVVSIGDLIVVAGLFILVFEAVTGKRLANRLKMGNKCKK